MLKQRIITAIVLLLVLLPALFAANPLWFLALGAVAVSAGAWEWLRLNGLNAWAFAAAVVMALACLLVFQLGFFESANRSWWIIAGAGWVLIGCALLRLGVAGWPRLPLMVRVLGGLVALLLAWMAMGQARHMGVAFLLSTMMVVWVADVFAYFFGRALGGKFTGGRKLAPAISPGKSWEGVLGGMLGVVLVGFVWLQLVPVPASPDSTSFFHMLMQTRGKALFVLSLVFLTAMSVVGDLTESLVKRSCGAKDSSQLLPGHGGVLDRIDALLPALPLALMLVLI